MTSYLDDLDAEVLTYLLTWEGLSLIPRTFLTYCCVILVNDFQKSMLVTICLTPSPFLSLTGDVLSHATPSCQDFRQSPVIGQLIDFE